MAHLQSEVGTKQIFSSYGVSYNKKGPKLTTRKTRRLPQTSLQSISGHQIQKVALNIHSHGSRAPVIRAPTIPGDNDYHHPSSSTSPRSSSTPLPSTSWRPSGQHTQEYHQQIDPHELPDHLWTSPSTSSSNVQPHQLHGCASRHQIPSSQGLRLAPRLDSCICLRRGNPNSSNFPINRGGQEGDQGSKPITLSFWFLILHYHNHINSKCNHCIQCIDRISSIHCADSANSIDCISYLYFTIISYCSFHITDYPAEFYACASSTSSSTSQRGNFRESASTSEGETSRALTS